VAAAAGEPEPEAPVVDAKPAGMPRVLSRSLLDGSDGQVRGGTHGRATRCLFCGRSPWRILGCASRQALIPAGPLDPYSKAFVSPRIPCLPPT
jgi:hypothetical protein